MISVDANLEDALLALMQARDRARLFQYEEKHIERIALLIRALHKTKNELAESKSCVGGSVSNSKALHSA